MDKLTYIMMPTIALLVVALNVFTLDITDEKISPIVNFYTMLYGVSGTILSIVFLIFGKEESEYPTLIELILVTLVTYIGINTAIVVSSVVVESPELVFVPLGNYTVEKPLVVYKIPLLTTNIYIPVEVLIVVVLQLIVAFSESLLFNILLPRLFYNLSPQGLTYISSILFPSLVFSSLHYRAWGVAVYENIWSGLFPCLLAGMVMNSIYILCYERRINAESGIILGHMLYNLTVIMSTIV